MKRIMPESYEIKPNKTAFLTYKFLKGSFFLLIFFIFLYFILKIFFNPVLYIITAFMVFSLFSYYSLSVKYKKEKYVFLPNKIIHKAGGIFSDRETELVIRNVTHVTMRLPFIEKSLFSTGSVSIESAGSGRAEIRLASIDNPDQIYKYVEKVMKYNGFKLTKSQLIQQEKPSSIGVFFEVFKHFVSAIFVIFIIGLNIIADSAANFSNMLSFFKSNIGIFFLLFSVILIWLLIKSVFRFLDLKSRIYDVYSDTLTYSEGFLSKNYSFMPIENLSDSTITQTLVDKIFGLYDVKISCQGSKQEIHFKNMVNGPKLEENIDKLIAKSRSLVGTLTKTAKVAKQASYKPKALLRDTRFTAVFKMDTKRTIIPFVIVLPICLILFPLLLPWGILLVVSFIRINTTTYHVKPNSMEEQYDFISSKTKEFANDKITAVILKENFIDKWFNTCSIHFWSIGSSEDIKFVNIPKTANLYASILAKSSITNKEIIYQMDSDYRVSEMFKSILPLTILSILILFGSIISTFLLNWVFIVPMIIIIILYVLLIVYKTAYYKQSKLSYFRDYVYFTRGIFFKEFYYVLYNNVKDITTVKYPFSKLGTIRFNIAGEHIVQQGKNQTIVSNSFQINYIDNIDNKDELIDLIFYRRPSKVQIAEIEANIENYSPKPIHVSKPAIANTLFGLIIISFILFPLILFLPISIPLVIWSIKVKSYIIQPYRVLTKSGILYKRQVSIVFNKIDHINYDQGMLNKMFKNGNITVNTTGSSRAELTIKNIYDFNEFYEILKKYY